MGKNFETFKTINMGLAITLMSVGFALMALEEAGGRRKEFIFLDAPGLQDTIAKFWAKELLIEPQGFINNERELKSRLYGPKENNAK